MADIFPRPDEAFDAWLTAIVNYMSANSVALGLSSTEVTACQTLANAYHNARGISDAAQVTARGAVASKDSARDAVEPAIRRLVAQAQAFPGTTDAMRALMQIPIRDATRSTAPPPTVAPQVSVDPSNRLQHVISFLIAGTPPRRGKPAGVAWARVYGVVLAAGAPAPTSLDQLEFLAKDTSTPYLVEYDGADAGKVAWYWVCWANSQDEEGPFAEPVSAMILG